MSASHELSWAAGFFDGEGTTICVKGVRRLDVVVGQVNRDNLYRFQSSIGGLGTIGPPRQHGKWRPISRFVAVGRAAHQCIRMLWPYLGEEKRDQSLLALIEWEMRRADKRALFAMGRCVRGHALSKCGIYTAPDGGRECVACRKLRHDHCTDKPRRPTAFEVRLDVREYRPKPINARSAT